MLELSTKRLHELHAQAAFRDGGLSPLERACRTLLPREEYFRACNQDLHKYMQFAPTASGSASSTSARNAALSEVPGDL